MVLKKMLGQSITLSVETNSGFWKIGESLKDISRVSSRKCSIKAPALCNTCVYVLIEIYLKLSIIACALKVQNFEFVDPTTLEKSSVYKSSLKH